MAVDLLYSVMLFLLVTALVLGSFMIKVVSTADYPSALAQTLFAIAVVLIGVELAVESARRIQRRQVSPLAIPADDRTTVRALDAKPGEACRAGAAAQPIPHTRAGRHGKPAMGGGCRLADCAAEGQVGTRSKFHAELPCRSSISTFTRIGPSVAALTVHLKLLAQLLGYFYEAKRREQQQRQNAYHQAIFETGARLTHDVKNLLQSLKSLCSAVEHSNGPEPDKLQALMQRQLPQIALRLQATLDKLQAPSQLPIEMVDAAAWWDELKQRYALRNVEFTLGSAKLEGELPGDLFSSVAENLIQNALYKANSEPGLRISATLVSGDAMHALKVCDSGTAIRPSIVDSLFSGPVKSQNGLGIGLYQAAKQAERLGYRLLIAGNENGKVCFELASRGQGS